MLLEQSVEAGGGGSAGEQTGVRLGELHMQGRGQCFTLLLGELAPIAA